MYLKKITKNLGKRDRREALHAYCFKNIEAGVGRGDHETGHLSVPVDLLYVLQTLKETKRHH